MTGTGITTLEMTGSGDVSAIGESDSDAFFKEVA